MPHLKILTVSDIHQRIALYHQLSSAIDCHRPDVVCVVGDWLEAQEMPGDHCFSPEACALFFSEVKCPVVFVPGNHDHEGLLAFSTVLKERGKPFNFLSGRAATIGPLIIIGFPPSGLDYPSSEWLPKILKNSASPRRGVSPARTLWLCHEPPTTELARPGAINEDLKEAIETYQPLLVVSGHDHTTPIRTGIWQASIGLTTCINAGQMVYPEPGILCYTVLELEFSRPSRCLATSFTVTRYD